MGFALFIVSMAFIMTLSDNIAVRRKLAQYESQTRTRNMITEQEWHKGEVPGL